MLDVYSRRIVGWSIADHLRSELVVDALEMARWRRRPRRGQTVVHSDRGSQYTAWAFGQRLRAAGLLGSMGRVASALDNAMMESFFGDPAARAARPQHLGDAGGAGAGDLRVDRGLVQPAPAALDARVPLTEQLRAIDLG